MYVKIVLLVLKCLLNIIDVMCLDLEKKASKDDTGDFLSEDDALFFGDMMYFRHEIEQSINNYVIQNKNRHE